MSTYEHNDMLTCAIIWEDILATRSGDDDFGRWLNDQFSEVGTYEMREHASTLAVAMNAAWSKTEWLHGCAAPFDWEFVPKVLNYLFQLQGDLSPEGLYKAAYLAAFEINQEGTGSWSGFQYFDSRLVTLFKSDNGETYWDDADPLAKNAVLTALGIYGRCGDGMAHHLLDIELSEHMATRGLDLLTAINLYVES